VIVTGVTCCDETQLPQANDQAKRRVADPNHLSLPSRSAGFSISVPRPMIFRPTGIQAGVIWTRPAKRLVVADLAGTGTPYPYGIVFPYPGTWYVYYDGAAVLEGTVLDTGCTLSLNGFSSPVHTAPVVGAGPASTAGLAANALRRYALFVNDSNNAIYLNLGGTAVVNTGILIEPSGSYSLRGENLWRGAVNFISSLAADRLLVTEGT